MISAADSCVNYIKQHVGSHHDIVLLDTSLFYCYHKFVIILGYIYKYFIMPINAQRDREKP